jgi:hypothetical protein
MFLQHRYLILISAIVKRIRPNGGTTKKRLVLHDLARFDTNKKSFLIAQPVHLLLHLLRHQV